MKANSYTQKENKQKLYATVTVCDVSAVRLQ